MENRKPITAAVVLGLGLAFMMLAALPAAATDQPGCRLGNVPNPAVNCPDRFAWEVFTKVNTLAGNSAGQLLWETWATDRETFPCPPEPEKCKGPNPPAMNCPTWPDQFRIPLPELGTQRGALPQLRTSRRLADAGATSPPQSLEIVHRNRPTFNYIVEHNLWWVEGLAQSFEDGFVFDFPHDAIEFKSNWNLLGPGDDPSRYVTMKYEGATYGLVAFHISTKDLPNWFWSTFEHVDNPGRCDFLGCHDSFGVTPADIPPHPVELGKQYPPGELNPELKAWLAKLPPVLQNYRLKGSQVDYTTPTGLASLLGNSVTEAGFVQTASCITCHGRATIGSGGTSPYPVVAGLTPDFQSFNGPPLTEWYYSNDDPIHRWSVQSDFVWAIPFKANSTTATTACCAARGQGNNGPACQ